jgi:hypothetical protein
MKPSSTMPNVYFRLLAMSIKTKMKIANIDARIARRDGPFSRPI